MAKETVSAALSASLFSGTPAIILLIAIAYAGLSIVVPHLLFPFWLVEWFLLYQLHEHFYQHGVPMHWVAYLIVLPGLTLAAASILLKPREIWMSVALAWCIIGTVSAVRFPDIIPPY